MRCRAPKFLTAAIAALAAAAPLAAQAARIGKTDDPTVRADSIYKLAVDAA